MQTQIHIVSDSNFLDNLYELNLRIYVGVEAIVHANTESFLDEASKNVMTKRLFIIRADLLDVNHEAIEKILNAKKDKVIIIGESNSALSFDLLLKNRFDIRELVRTLAKELDITAKEMSQKEVPEYFPISKAIFNFLEVASCAVYYKRDGQPIKLYKKNASITNMHEELDDNDLFIPANERLDFINRASILILEELRNQKITAAEKIELMAQGAQFISEEIYQNEKVTDEIANISSLCVNAFNEISSGVPKAKNLIALLLDNKDGYIYTHSVFSTYVAKEIISKMPWGSKEQQEKVAFVLFFHDLYLVPIYGKYDDAVDEEDLLFRDDVTQEDKEIIFDHAAMACDLIKGFPKAPMGADTLAAQHHGAVSGKGFPGIFGDDISPLAKVILISEEVAKHVFVSLYAKDSKTAFDKDIIKEKLLEKFQRVTYKKIIAAFEEVEL